MRRGEPAPFGVQGVLPEDADDLRRQFDAVLSGGLFPRRTTNLHLRHPERGEPAKFRVRVDLNEAQPPIWRRLDLRSDLTLDAVHQVVQTPYGWSDSHLHRFSIGGEPFDAPAEWFLCEYDVEEGEDEGTADAEVTLDETLASPGDVLHYVYVYDYGDHWDLTIRLEEVRPVADDAVCSCVDGARAAPPDDCGGLRAPTGDLAAWGVRADLAELLHRLSRTPVGDDLIARTSAIGRPEAG